MNNKLNQRRKNKMARWILGLLVGLVFAFASVLLLVWVLWLLWKHRDQQAEAPVIEIEAKAPPLAAEPPAAEAEVEKVRPALLVEAEEPAPPAPDDLKRIEGIGPKISSVLQAAGIMTFAQLAATEASRLEQILEEADPRLLRLADPTTWPEQARQAAAGDWDALEALQNELKAGRRG
jgi:predicted flap endonuclease-1-like 5' DNA nuclease